MKRMRIRRHGFFAGGIVLNEDKSQTINAPIIAPPKPSCLMLPLTPGGKTLAECIVKPGTRVLAGQKLAKATNPSAVDVFAPLAGIISGITQAKLIDRGRFISMPCLKMTNLSTPKGIDNSPASIDYDNIKTSELIKMLSSGGLTTHGSRTQPLGQWLGRAIKNSCHTIILNAMENAPCPTADHALLCHHGDEVIEGLSILARAIGADTATLAVDSRRTSYYHKVPKPAAKRDVTTVALPHKYPIGDDNILARVLTGKTVPLAADAMSLSVAIIDVPTCFAIYQWVGMGIPATSRVVTVAGQQALSPGNYFTPHGMMIDELTRYPSGPVLHGGLIRGTKTVAGAVVGPATNVLATPKPSTPPLSTQCIRCAWCSDHCPAGINVAAMNDAFELNDINHAKDSGVQACIECGVCSYICPARLPLRQRLVCLKRQVYREQYQKLKGVSDGK